MKLRKYMAGKNISVKRAACELGIVDQYVYGIRNDRMIPGRKLALKILKWSDGKVTFKDLPGWN